VQKGLQPKKTCIPLQPANKEAELFSEVLKLRFKANKKFKINFTESKKVYTFATRKQRKEKPQWLSGIERNASPKK
jgi:hypothetical protein